MAADLHSSPFDDVMEGERAVLERFVERLPREAPKLAVIENTELRFTDELVGYEDFRILQSKTEALRDTLI